MLSAQLYSAAYSSPVSLETASGCAALPGQICRASPAQNRLSARDGMGDLNVPNRSGLACDRLPTVGNYSSTYAGTMQERTPGTLPPHRLIVTSEKDIVQRCLRISFSVSTGTFLNMRRIVF
jgi:hypothetical protein